MQDYLLLPNGSTVLLSKSSRKNLSTQDRQLSKIKAKDTLQNKDENSIDSELKSLKSHEAQERYPLASNNQTGTNFRSKRTARKLSNGGQPDMNVVEN